MIVDKEPFFKIGNPQEYDFEPPNEWKKYKKLRKQLGSEWKYYDYESYPLTTKINELGYRSNTIRPTDQYYVALGCSNTFGQYLHEEDRYSNIIEKQTGIPVINLGICGGSSMSVYTNLCKLLYNDYPKPKKIFIQWPEQNRLSVNGQSMLRLINPHMPQIDVFRFLVKYDALEVMSKFCFDMTHNIFNVPIIEFAVNDWVANFYGVKEIHRLDKARDNEHCGVETNKSMADFILNEMQNG